MNEGTRDAEALVESEARLRSLSQATSEGIAIQVGGEILVANDALGTLLGVPPEDLIGREVLDFIAPGSRDEVRDHLRVGSSETPYPIDVVRSDGSLIPVEVTARNLDYGGRAARVAVLRDVSGRIAAEEALRSAEAYARALFDQNPVAIWVWDAENWTFLDVNDACVRQYGYPREEFLRMTAFDIRPLEEHERLRAAMSVAGPEVRNFGLWRHRKKDGTLFDVEVHSSEITFSGRRARISLAIDVTEKLRAEQRLREAEARYRSLVETIPAVVYLDELGAISSTVYMSPQSLAILGYAPEEFSSDPDLWQALVHPEDRERVLAGAREQIVTLAPYAVDYRMIAKDGRTVWIRDEGRVVRDESGEPLYWQGFWIDVTARVRAEEAVRESEERYRAVVENSIDMIALVDPNGTFIYVSPSYGEVLGYGSMELVGRSVVEFVHPEDVELLATGFTEVDEVGSVIGRAFRLRHKAGHWVPVEGSARAISFDGGRRRVIVTASRDVSERDRADEERRDLLARLVAAQEEERHRIAADVHDDPVQAMTTVALRLGILRSKLKDRDLDQELDKLEVSVDRAIDRLRYLLFALHPRTLDLDGLVPAIREYVRSLTDEDGSSTNFRISASLEREPSPDRRLILYRIAQEALTNVRKHANARQVTITLSTQDDGVLLRIEDDGKGGLPSDLGDRPGHLGLAAMRERAELAGGWWRIDPREGGGTVVACFVPHEE
jgi:PAS domain S-box-containing protein